MVKQRTKLEALGERKITDGSDTALSHRAGFGNASDKRRISEPCPVPQLERPVRKRRAVNSRQKPFQAGENRGTVGLAKRDHDHTGMRFKQMGNRVKKVPVCRQKDRLKPPGFLKDKRIRDPLLISPSEIMDFVPIPLKKPDRRLREILVEQKRHEAAS